MVAPGAFRTNFLNADSINIAQHTIGDYTAVHNAQQLLLEKNGKQDGDPEKAAAAIIELAHMENPPLYLLLGDDAYNRAMAKLDRLKTEYMLNEELSKAMAYMG